MRDLEQTMPPDVAMRTIATARTVEAINAAVREGFFPLIKVHKPHPEIARKIAVFQCASSGHVTTIGDFRQTPPGYAEPVTDFIFYYPYRFPNPFAAYLIPPDLEAGDVVWLEDLIEDIVGARWNQGDVTRLKSATAIWTGSDVDIIPVEPAQIRG